MRNGARLRRLVRDHLRRREEEHEVRLERVQHQRGRDAERGAARRRSRRIGDAAPSSRAPRVAADPAAARLDIRELRRTRACVASARQRSRRSPRARRRRTTSRRRTRSRPSRRIRSCRRPSDPSRRRRSISESSHARAALALDDDRLHAHERDGDRVAPRGERHEQHAGEHRRRHLRRRGEADRRALVQRVPPLHREVDDRHVDRADERQQRARRGRRGAGRRSRCAAR